MNSPLAPPSTEDVHVWQVCLDVEGDELRALTAVLSADERERARRFVRPRDASRSAAARGHLRRLLGRYLDCPATEVALGTGPYGKPYIATPGAGWLRYNVSHSGEGALIAVSNGREVGVDIERIQPELADASLGKLFTPAEQRTLTGLTPEEYVSQCFRLWTRKEAVVKGLGMGLSVPLDGVNVLDDRVQFAPDLARKLLPGPASEWTVQSLSLGEERSGAVALEVAATSASHRGR